MEEDKPRRFFNPYHQQDLRARGRPLWIYMLLSSVSVFGLSFCLTCLYLAMRGIMRLGGFVASGGPYEIAHPAPRYVWIFPVAIILGLACAFIHGALAGKLGGLNLVALAWPALFISLGWNFLEFGFHPPGAGGLVWGWLVCGVAFWLMGFIPLIIFISYFLKGLREERLRAKSGKSLDSDIPRKINWKRRVISLFQLVALFAGIYAAMLFLAPQTAAQEAPPAASAASDLAGKPGAGREPRSELSQHASDAEETSTEPLKVFMSVRGKRLEVVEKQDGIWQILYDGKTYSRLSDLPAEARGVFLDSLRILQSLVVENR